MVVVKLMRMMTMIDVDQMWCAVIPSSLGRRSLVSRLETARRGRLAGLLSMLLVTLTQSMTMKLVMEQTQLLESTLQLSPVLLKPPLLCAVFMRLTCPPVGWLTTMMLIAMFILSKMFSPSLVLLKVLRHDLLNVPFPFDDKMLTFVVTTARWWMMGSRE